MTRSNPLSLASTLVKQARPTAIVPLEESRIRLFAKLECNNAIGSLKDRPALWILYSALRRGTIHEGATLIESSSGNFAVAMAIYGRLLGLPFIPVIDPNIAPAHEDTLYRLCDRVEKVTERDDTGGFLKHRLQRVNELCRSIDGCFWTNQYANPDAVEAHYRFTAEEICEKFSQLDYVFIGVSTGATVAGISRRLKEKFPRVCIVAVDAEGSIIFGGPPKKRHIAGIGSSISPPFVEKALIDDVVIVPEAETVAACRELLARYGLFVGGSSGSCYAAIKRYFKKSTTQSPPHVLFLCADRGTVYVDTVFDDAWAARFEHHD